MRSSRGGGFEAVVFALLAAACSCGGMVVVNGSGEGGAAQGGDDGAGGVVDAGEWTPPNATAACGWTHARVTSCLWEVLFSGDPMQCAGFANTNATDSQCAAICGVGPKGQAVVSCYVGISNNPAGAFQLVCKGPADTC